MVVRKVEVVCGDRAELGGQTRSTGLSQLVGVELEPVAKTLGLLENATSLRHAERGTFTKHVAERRLAGEGWQHLITDAVHIALPAVLTSVFRWDGVGAKKGWDDGGQPRLTGKILHDAETSLFGNEIQPIAGLALDGSGAMGGEAA